VIVRRSEVRDVTAKSRAREDKEAASRKRLLAGELGLDMYGMRDRLKEKGLRYL
jgi:4-hydroxy-4-methyl-2-oxoglutarate aldolase